MNHITSGPPDQTVVSLRVGCVDSHCYMVQLVEIEALAVRTRHVLRLQVFKGKVRL
jgi:hypothetical protein